MIHRTLTVLSLLCVATPAFAAADVAVTVAAPSGKYVYETGRYTVTVKNIGNKSASNVTVSVTLPQTHTSPTVYVMGTVGAMKAGCTRSGRTITCPVGTVNRGVSTQVWFDLALPQNSVPLSIGAAVSTTSVENVGGAANNSTTVTPALLNYPVVVGPTFVATNDHCTGTNLTSYFECTLFPSSIASHETVFNTGGTLSFVDAPASYTGDWYQSSSSHLHFRYYEDNVLVAEFDGRGTTPDCFEGITTFGSTYVSPYEVCFQ